MRQTTARELTDDKRQTIEGGRGGGGGANPRKTNKTAMMAEVVVFCWLLNIQQHASVSQGRICSDSCTSCHIEIEVADQTFHLSQSQYTDAGPTSPSTDPITPGAWQGSHWSANFSVTGITRPRKNPGASGIRTRSRGGRLIHQANEAVVAEENNREIQWQKGKSVKFKADIKAQRGGWGGAADRRETNKRDTMTDEHREQEKEKTGRDRELVYKKQTEDSLRETNRRRAVA